MPIRITQQSTRRKTKKATQSRNWVALLALVQLPISIGFVLFVYFFTTSFQQQDLKLSQIGAVTAITDTFESVRAFRFPVRHWLGIADDVPEIYLDVEQENYRALEYAAINDLAIAKKRAEGEALRQNLFVKANIRFEGQTIRSKIRLKGDRSVHWATPESWSFRVELKDQKTLFGMRKFSLQKPIVRNYIYEWFFHKTLKHEGLIGLRYNFVKVYVNGKSQGVYALEEHFDKILLENNNRREAPILRFSEDGMTEDRDWYQMPVIPYGRNRWAEKNPELLRQATNLLEDFQSGEKMVGEVFDVALLARYLALVDLQDSFHGALAKSIKFYYNPINQKLEPVGFDAQFNDRQFPVLVAELSDFRGELGYSDRAYFNALFGPDIHDKIEFWEAYVRELERISQPQFLDNLFADIGPQLDENLDLMYAEIPWHDMMSGHPLTSGPRFLFYFSKDKLYARQRFIRHRLVPKAAITAYVKESDEQRIVLHIANGQKLPIEVLEVVHDRVLYKPTERILLNEKPRYQKMSFSEYVLTATGPQPEAKKVKGPNKLVTLKPAASAVTYRVPGSTRSREYPVFGWAPSFTQSRETPQYNRFTDLEPRRFLEVDESNKSISFKRGIWKIARDIVIPDGYMFVAQPGTAIDLLNGSRIVSHSPLQFAGTELDPIVIGSSDGTGKGLVVLEANSRSKLSYVRFDGMAIADGESWPLSSIVTFHRSDVDFDACFFGNNQSEDALNIVRSDFTITNSTFSRTFGDAFDSDFSTGTVSDTQYRNIGNDAIDVSGSSIVVRNVGIIRAGDKGISVGEASRLEAEFTWIDGANIGVAVKDQSFFEGMTLTIKHANIGLALFQKKPEYGAASAVLWRTSLTDVAESHWLEEGSSLDWNGREVEPNKTDLKKVLYPDEFVEAESPAESGLVK